MEGVVGSGHRQGGLVEWDSPGGKMINQGVGSWSLRGGGEGRTGVSLLGCGGV